MLILSGLDFSIEKEYPGVVDAVSMKMKIVSLTEGSLHFLWYMSPILSPFIRLIPLHPADGGAPFEKPVERPDGEEFPLAA